MGRRIQGSGVTKVLGSLSRNEYRPSVIYGKSYNTSARQPVIDLKHDHAGSAIDLKLDHAVGT